MILKPTSRRPGKAAPLPPPKRGAPNDTTAAEPDSSIVQAKHDLDAGQVDIDMHATRGLGAELRARLVPGPGGNPPAPLPPTLAQQKSDFTAEGSPPPGKVAKTVPARS